MLFKSFVAIIDPISCLLCIIDISIFVVSHIEKEIHLFFFQYPLVACDMLHIICLDRKFPKNYSNFFLRSFQDFLTESSEKWLTMGLKYCDWWTNHICFKWAVSCNSCESVSATLMSSLPAVWHGSLNHMLDKSLVRDFCSFLWKSHL